MPARLTLSPLWCCAAVSLALAAGPARAQELSLGPQGNGGPPAPESVHKGYAGVKPGGDQVPTTLVKPGTTPATITWPGFQTRPDGSSRVFLQSTAQLSTHAAMTSDKTLTIDLGDVRIAARTNRYPLFTNFFNTPVTRVELKRAGKRTLLEVTLRAAVQPSISSEQARSGFYFVYIDFPPGQYVAAPAADRGPPPPAKVDTIDPSADASGQGADAMDASADLNASGGSKPKAKAKAKARVGFAVGR
jgi:hypothetical protein